MTTSNEESQSNPEIGMQADSLEAAEANQVSGSEDFFDQLDNEVNGGIIDDTEVTQSQPKWLRTGNPCNTRQWLQQCGSVGRQHRLEKTIRR